MKITRILNIQYFFSLQVCEHRPQRKQPDKRTEFTTSVVQLCKSILK